jgi:hypothetical protein
MQVHVLYLALRHLRRLALLGPSGVYRKSRYGVPVEEVRLCSFGPTLSALYFWSDRSNSALSAITTSREARRRAAASLPSSMLRLLQTLILVMASALASSTLSASTGSPSIPQALGSAATFTLECTIGNGTLCAFSCLGPAPAGFRWPIHRVQRALVWANDNGWFVRIIGFGMVRPGRPSLTFTLGPDQACSFATFKVVGTDSDKLSLPGRADR